MGRCRSYRPYQMLESMAREARLLRAMGRNVGEFFGAAHTIAARLQATGDNWRMYNHFALPKLSYAGQLMEIPTKYYRMQRRIEARLFRCPSYGIPDGLFRAPQITGIPYVPTITNYTIGAVCRCAHSNIGRLAVTLPQRLRSAREHFLLLGEGLHPWAEPMIADGLARARDGTFAEQLPPRAIECLRHLAKFPNKDRLRAAVMRTIDAVGRAVRPSSQIPQRL